MSAFDDLKKRMIAVDTEYQSTIGGQTRLERETGIHKVYCAAFCTADGKSWATWLDDQSYPDILEKAAEILKVENPLFVNYYYNAEWEAFRRIGADITKTAWLDAWLLYRMRVNAQGEEWGKYKSAQGLVDAVKDILGICRDSTHKAAMRQLCIDGQTEGHEKEIIDYCLEDVRDLIPLVEALWHRLEARMHSGQTLIFTPRCRGESRSTGWIPFERQLFDLMESLKAFTCISHRGLPVNIARLDAVRRGAAIHCDRLVREFVTAYPDSFTFTPIEESTKSATRYVSEEVRHADYASLADMLSAFQSSLDGKSEKTRGTVSRQAEMIWELTRVKGISGTWHRSEARCREYLAECLKARGVTEWKRTDTGKLSLDTDSLKDEFHHERGGNFGADYYHLSKATNCLKGIQKEGKDSWVQTLDRDDAVLRYQSLRPFTARTGRCQPQASRGFVFAWYKALYCVLEPPEGRWLVELDFGSEETFIQAKVFNDPRYDEIYHSKDMYLWMGVQLGMIPQSDFDTMTKAELKHKYKAERDRLKTYTLALGYGAGTQKLASKVKMPVDAVREMQTRTKTHVFPHSTAVREYLKNKLTAYGSMQTRCLWLQNGWHTVIPQDTEKMTMNAPLNFPIQGMGSAILQALVVELERMHVETLATIHDAVFFMVDEGDMDTIKAVADTMARVANDILGVKDGEKGMQVGDPEIVRHGEIWTPEHAYDGEAREILAAGGYRA